ncbi:ABC transporter permease [Rhizosaccharibacter radicis]|uniref:ABC transporter permease n=1 Tax=Rhizosaccharibacter radicis TaxID=2782605 RepID=A0ABT1W263_9PROT|nr:ABC transporter permease [Acetobacteraceae bacterium KSS12]
MSASTAIASRSGGARTWRGVAVLLLRRVLLGLSVLLAAVTLAFFALHVVPGDVVSAILGGPAANPTPEAVAAAIREYGLDRPLIVQYLIYLVGLLHGDLGRSFTQHLPVALILREQVGPTLLLTFWALILAWALALLSVLGTTRRRPWLSRLGATLETVAAAMPPFWLGILLLFSFSFAMPLFPPAGSDRLSTLVLPGLAMAIPLAGFLARVTREALELALEQPFILSARMRGLGDLSVRLRHALRHALLPGIALSAWALGALVGNAVVVEVIFSRKGIGRQLFLAVSTQDIPLAMGIVLVVSACYVLSNLAADVLSLWADPRLRSSRR